MTIKARKIIPFVLACCTAAFALEPNQVLVIANSDVAESVQIAGYYCKRRKVPRDNMLALSLGNSLNDTIAREDYDKKLAEPIRKKLNEYMFPTEIRCLLTTYGVPVKVTGRGPLTNQQGKVPKLQESAKQLKDKIENSKQNDSDVSASQKQSLNRKLHELQSEIDRIGGKETNASVDSELSMVLHGDYELYRWRRNQLRNNLIDLGSSTLMVSRIDGPGADIVRGLIDKAIKAETTSLKGVAYIDSRGLKKDKRPYTSGYFDRSLRSLAVLISFRSDITAKEERTEKLFQPGECPRTAIYCGWYSLKKYVDAFDFVDGAIGYHIASLEAVDLRDPASSQWCPAMLKDGITATLGAVAEPYIHSFPEPRAFFAELLSGRCLVEAYYRTKPFNSWQLVLIGDPLYRPFKPAR